MVIVFGTRSFTIQRWKTNEVGLASDPNENYFVLLRRQYFHLLYIPFFPLKKYWAVLKPDGKYYEAPANWYQQLHELERKNPVKWYLKLLPFSIFFVALLVVLLVFLRSIYISSIIDNYEEQQQRQTMMKQQYAKDTAGTYAKEQRKIDSIYQLKISGIKKLIKNPATTDFYRIYFTRRGNPRNFFFKVQRITETEVFLVTTSEDPFSGYNNSIRDSAQLLHFSDDKEYKRGYWFPRAQLEAALKENETANFLDWPVTEDKAKYYLGEVIRIPSMSDTLSLADKSKLK